MAPCLRQIAKEATRPSGNCRAKRDTGAFHSRFATCFAGVRRDSVTLMCRNVCFKGFPAPPAVVIWGGTDRFREKYMFWALAILMIAVSLWAIGRPLLRGNGTGPRAAEQDLQVYKDQLAEVERDLARGVLAPDEAESARIEVSRRILAADKRVQAQNDAKGAAPAVNRTLLALVVLVLAGGSLGLYALLGNPGLPDRPLKERLAEAQQRRAARMDQASAEALAPPVEVGEVPQEYVDLVEKLRTALADRPNDIQGLRLLALHESRLGNYVAARTSQEKLVGLLGDAASGEDYSALGEYLVFAAGGYVSPQAEEALVKALQLDPTDQRARYFSGLALAQNGRPDVAYQMWSGLLAEGPADAPWIAPIRSQMDALARAAGIDPATAPPGPSAGDVDAAADMTPEERQQMIRGMVAGLAERLATEGGTPEEWARLIRAYGVLGDLDKAALVWTEAKQTFADNPEAMALLRAEAQELGID